ncbi:Rieske (2Fe-2S) protein [Algoriphagus yeomjeoni]|uniref:Rieske (2Fe-2S) protein n=1 Tax=Algoriphagus yeomjeoni TaxID=291403 RepID=UPI003CE50595
MKTFLLGSTKRQVLEMIPECRIHKINLGDQVIALVRSQENFHAFQADCPHRGTSLLEGSLSSEHEVICPLHRYRFNLMTGEVKVGSCGNLEIYPTELTQEGLKVFISNDE